jgi:glycosyltransferase involved in cell wall biosynthesis
MRFSIITPTFNRRSTVPRAIDSSLEFCRAVGDCDVIVIDDASQDGTADMIRATYANELEAGVLKLLVRPRNGGSTVAKTQGARSAGGDWLIFIDDDDEFAPGASERLPAFAGMHSKTAVLLFRCIDQDENLVGAPALPAALSFERLLNDGTPGECLPVVSRIAFLKFPSENDIPAYEFLAILRIVRAYGPAMLSDIVARRYHMEGGDRMTSRAGNLRRAKSHAEGFLQMYREFGSMMPWRKRFGILLRIICYRLVAALGIGQSQPK